MVAAITQLHLHLPHLEVFICHWGGGGRKHLEKLGIQNLESRSLKLPYEVSIVIDAFIPVINGVV